MDEDFIITNVGYYKRDNEMNVTVDVRPSHLNGNHIQFQKLQTSEGFVPNDQCINLAEPEVIDDGNIENYFESLLNYISIKGFGKEKPQFVTNKSFLGYLASKPISGKILIFRYMGVIFISYEKRKRKSPKDTEIDALDESDQHVELKAIIRGTEDINSWKYRISTFYWKMLFGGCSMMIVGDRTGAKKAPGQKTYVETKTGRVRNQETGEVIDQRTNTSGKDFPAYSLCRIEELKFEEIIEKMEKAKQKEKKERAQQTIRHTSGIPFQERNVDEGKERVRHFLLQVQRVCRYPGMCILAEADQLRKGFWNFETVNEQNEKIQEFVKLVRTKMDIWKTNFPN